MGVPIIAAVGAAKGAVGVVSSITNAFGGKLVYGIKKEEFAQRLTNERWFRYAYANGYDYFQDGRPLDMPIGEFFFQLFGYYFTTYENNELKAQTGNNYGYNFMFNPNASPMSLPHSWTAEKMDALVMQYWKPSPQQLLRLDPVTSPYYQQYKNQIVPIIGEPTVAQTANAGFGGGYTMPLILAGLAVGAIFVMRK